MLAEYPLHVDEASPLALFDKDFKHFYDTGLEAVLHDTSIRVYRHMRRLIWRTPRSGVLELDRLTKSGGLGLCVSRDALCSRTNLSESPVKLAIADLMALGWIKRVAVIQTGSVFELGKQVKDDDGRRIRETAIGEGALYADGFCDRVYNGLLQYAIDKGYQDHGPWLVSETHGGVPWDERIAYCERYLNAVTPKARRMRVLRAVPDVAKG